MTSGQRCGCAHLRRVHDNGGHCWARVKAHRGGPGAYMTCPCPAFHEPEPEDSR